MSRSKSIIKQSEGRLHRLAAKLLLHVPVVWRRAVREILLDNVAVLQRLPEVCSIRQMALVVAVLFAVLVLACGVYLLCSRLVVRFSFRAEQ